MTADAHAPSGPLRLAPAGVAGSSKPRRPRARHGRALAWTFNLVASAASLAAGTVIGIALTAAALRNGEEIGAVTVGGWQLPVGEGTPTINPYQRAVLARTGKIPMDAGQGVAFTTTRDQTGRKLDRRCAYTVSGPVPRARFWTLGVADRNGFAIPNPANRFAFTSADILRDESGAFRIVVAPAVQPGNWLPLAGSGRFDLVLRLYDSAVPGLGPKELGALTLPTVVRTGCR